MWHNYPDTLFVVYVTGITLYPMDGHGMVGSNVVPYQMKGYNIVLYNRLYGN